MKSVRAKFGRNFLKPGAVLFQLHFSTLAHCLCGLTTDISLIRWDRLLVVTGSAAVKVITLFHVGLARSPFKFLYKADIYDQRIDAIENVINGRKVPLLKFIFSSVLFKMLLF